MSQAHIETSNWYEALTLNERGQFVGAAIGDGEAGAAPFETDQPVEQELAQKR